MKRFTALPKRQETKRRGSITVLAAMMMIMIFAFTVFTVDVGYITLTKAKLRTATDAATFAAASELSRGLGANPELSESNMELTAKQSAFEIAAAHDAGQLSVYLNSQRDIRLGQISWDTGSESWAIIWGQAPITSWKSPRVETKVPVPMVMCSYSSAR